MKNNILKVHEFDSIIEYEKHISDDGYIPMPKKQFDEFIAFIEAGAQDTEQEEVLNFCTIFTAKGKGKVIKIKNYVGLVRLNSGYQIQIMPKIDFNSNVKTSEQEKETQNIFLRMLQALKSPTFSKFNTANVEIRQLDIMEVFIAYYIHMLQELIKQDLKKDYVTTEDNLGTFKGKLLISQNIRYNLAHKERFFVQFDEYSVNRPINRIIKSTLLKLQRMTDNISNSRNIRQLLGVFDEIQPSVNFSKDFSSFVIDRSTAGYDLLMKWSEVFLMNRSFTNFAGDGKALSLLFPMHQLFEDYVALKMKQYFGNLGWNVSSQHKKYHVFDEPKPRFLLKPDIYMEKGKCKIILDTKWKKLKPNNNNSGVSGDDIYQMYVYAKKYNTPHIVLLYPLFSNVLDFASVKEPRFVSFEDGKIDVMVSVAFIDLSDIGSAMDNINCIINKQFEAIK